MKKESKRDRTVKSDRGLLVGMTMAILILSICGFLSLNGMIEIKEATSNRARARQTAFEISQILMSLVNIETGQRGFLIAREESFLEPYTEGRQGLEAQLSKVEELVKNSQRQRDNFATLKQSIHKRVEVIEETIRLARSGQHARAMQIVKSGVGKSHMDNVRREVGEMMEIQQGVIADYNAKTEAVTARSYWVVVGSSLFAILVASLSLFYLTRNQKIRAHAGRLLRDSNESLEEQKNTLSKIASAQLEISRGGLDTEKVMSVLVERANSVTHAEGTVIELVEGDNIIYHHASGTATQFLGMQIKIDGSFSGLCIRQGQTLLCEDTETDERVNREACRKVNVRSMIVSPLTHLKEVIGVIKCYSSKPHAFSLNDIEALQLTSGFLETALANAYEFSQKTYAMAQLQRAQEDLVAAKNVAEAATKTKSQFLANISHELRTPLHGILGMTRLLVDSKLEGQQAEYARNVFNAGENLLGIVNDVLDLSKIEAGKMDLEEIDFAFAGVLNTLTSTFQVLCDQKGLRLNLDVDPKIPPHLKGDPSRLRQILINLVGNAVKFTAKGEVTVRARMRTQTDEGVKLHFEIQDSGVGMDAATVNNLFTEFMQADASTTRKFGGTGLGLSISKKMVERMSGEIGANSEVGKGTTFWFNVNLKVGQSQERVAEAQNSVIPSAQKYAWKILVADDNILNQKIAAKTLEKYGLACDMVSNGKEAVQAVHDREYHLILMDCQMPEMDGYAATAEIRKGGHKCDPNMPILAMTAGAMKSEQQRCLNAGMSDYISKPFTLQNFAATIEKWLGAIDVRKAG